MAEPVLLAEGLVREFGKATKTRVLHGVSLRIEAGEFSALIGPSGSGKSTLLNLLGLLDRPTAGTITLAGRRTEGLGDVELTRYRGRTLGFVFQFHHLLPGFTALENVLIPAWADRGRADAALRKKATELLQRVGLGHRVNNRASDLSGGEAQRVAIARALVNGPPMVLADEPTGNLDTQSADGIFTLLRDFNRDQGTTFLIVTHDPRLAARCDRIVRLVDGRVVGDQRRGDDVPPGTFGGVDGE